ncbi:MAG: hypothetical protein ACO1SV_19045 [Fimbriimonas sp.]
MIGSLNVARKGKALVAVFVSVAALAVVTGCGSDSANQADVDSIQSEMRSQVPKGTETVPPEKATAGIQNAGPSRGGK